MHNPIYGIGGSSTALVTPFLDTRVDWTALSRLVRAADRPRHRLPDRLRQHRRGRLVDPVGIRARRADGRRGRIRPCAGDRRLHRPRHFGGDRHGHRGGIGRRRRPALRGATVCEADTGRHDRSYPRHRPCDGSSHRALRCPVALGRGDRRRYRGAAARRRVDHRPEGCHRRSVAPHAAARALRRRVRAVERR